MTYSLHNIPFIVVQFYLQDFLQRNLTGVLRSSFAARYMSNFLGTLILQFSCILSIANAIHFCSVGRRSVRGLPA
jgi:hypothetical protein